MRPRWTTWHELLLSYVPFSLLFRLLLFLHFKFHLISIVYIYLLQRELKKKKLFCLGNKGKMETKWNREKKQKKNLFHLVFLQFERKIRKSVCWMVSDWGCLFNLLWCDSEKERRSCIVSKTTITAARIAKVTASEIIK